MLRRLWPIALIAAIACSSTTESPPTPSPRTPPPPAKAEAPEAKVSEEAEFALHDAQDLSGRGLPAPELALAHPGEAQGGGGGGGGVLSFDDEDEGPEEPEANPEEWRSSPLRPNQLRIDIGDDEPLPLLAVELTARVEGAWARVVIDATFENDRRDLTFEGRLQLRLPDGASPCALAFGESAFLDINEVELAALRSPQSGAATSLEGEAWLSARSSGEAVRAAILAPREQARESFEETVRENVDPALLEWSGAGVFSAQVFPLQPDRLHRLIVAYDLPLTRGADAWRLDLPLPDAPRRSALIELLGDSDGVTLRPTAKPQVSAGLTRYECPGAERIELRRPLGPAHITSGGAAGPHFALRFAAELPSLDDPGAPQALLLLDLSRSGRVDLERRLKLLEALLSESREDIQRFAVLGFHIGVRWLTQGWVANEPERVTALLTELRGLIPEGATDLDAALREALAPSWSEGPLGRTDLFLLGDGASTWGEAELGSVAAALRASKHRLFAYNAGAGVDALALQRLTRVSGGGLFNLRDEDELRAAARAHRSGGWRITELEAPGAVDALLAGQPTQVYPGQDLLCVGRGALTGPLTLKVERAGEVKALTVEVPAGLAGQLAERTYGVAAVQALEEARGGEALAKDLARVYRVVGQSCSLIMLEDEEDLEELEVDPERELAAAREARAAAWLAAHQSTVAEEGAKARWLRLLARRREVDAEAELPKAWDEALAALSDAQLSLPARGTRSELWLRASQGVREDYLASLDEGFPTRAATDLEVARRVAEVDAMSALVAKSSLLEVYPTDEALLRELADSAEAWGMKGEAAALWQRLLLRRPGHPHPWLALARLCRESSPAAALFCARVLATGAWDERFGDVARIAELEEARLLAAAGDRWPEPMRLIVEARRDALAVKARPGLVVLLSWNTDGADIDLHVTDPDGEECYYENTETELGGSLTRDVTEGFGPEMFVLAEPKPGVYKVEVKFYSAPQTRLGTRTQARVVVVRDWSFPEESSEEFLVELKGLDEKLPVTTLTIKD